MTTHLAMEPLVRSAPAAWTRTTFKAAFRSVDDRRGTRGIELLSLSSQGFLRPRAELGDRQPPSEESLPRYFLVSPGDLVVNPMWLTGGSIAVSDRVGAVSPDYRVFRPRTNNVHPRFVHHLLRTPGAFAQYRLYTRADTTFDRRVQQGDLDDLPLCLPPLCEQQRIATFLDDQLARLQQGADACDRLATGASLRLVAEIASALLTNEPGAKTALPWRPVSGWVMAPVGAKYQLALGKMLNEERTQSGRLRPYLRNTNVQWDTIYTDDLKLMDFPLSEGDRYLLRPGDLLICEGGQPGRSAVWDGREAEMYFQKALHRARPRQGARARWLLHCLRLCVARGAFADVQGTTIAHLTGEQLSALRLPFPPPHVQDTLIHAWDELASCASEIERTAQRQSALLEERKNALITACVTGAFDPTTASDRATDAVLQGVST